MDWAAPNLPNPRGGARPVFATTSQFDAKLQHELSKTDQTVKFEPKIHYLHHTWAGTFFSRPEYFFQPSTIPELQKIITLARRCRKRVSLKGFGHSPSDLTLTSSWLINLDNISEFLEVNVNSTPGLVRFQAGISLHDLNQALAKHNLTLPNLGSIDVQSVAGSIATATHGSSLQHGLLSQSITSLTILLSNAQLVTCSATKNPSLFRAALCSLGTLGIIVEITYQAVPDFNISWSQSLHPLSSILKDWDGPLWTTAEYTRVWWMTYLHRAVVWRAHSTQEAPRPAPYSFYGGKLGYLVYHNLLAISRYIPSLLPYVEWFVMGLQYGFSAKEAAKPTTAIQPAREGLLMDCLYSQFVNEWALPLSKGPEAIERMGAWINGDEKTARIPFSPKGVYIHAPIEVRAVGVNSTNNESGVIPYLDPTEREGPTLYLNAIMYRPYGRDPPYVGRYYEAFEWLMRDLGARPHWAKNFMHTDVEYIEQVYGEDMKEFMKIRNDVDPEGMFLGEWHTRNLPIEGKALRMAEEEKGRKRMQGFGDGALWEGKRRISDDGEDEFKDGAAAVVALDAASGSDGASSPPHTSASEESFDYMAKGEASMYAEREEEL